MTLARFHRPVAVAAESSPVTDAARTMRERRVGCVVVTRGDRPVGVLTDRDLALRVVAEGRDVRTTRVADVVTYDPCVVDEASSLEVVAKRMREHGVRRLPIVDANGGVVGIVTTDDLLVMLGGEISDVCTAVAESADATDSR